jgi:hypothetical protein
MSRRHIHYEAAFEDYLCRHRIDYTPIDEARKTAFAGARLKSFDFLVYPRTGASFIVDVKGRQFPYGGTTGRRRWENWVTQGDLDGLSRWRDVFGNNFAAMIVFAYWLTTPEEEAVLRSHHVFRGQHYAFLAVDAIDYRAHARVRSARWNTLTMPARTFRELAQPVPSTW